MPTWRDRWEGAANVVIVSETPPTEEGTVEDALLFVLDGCDAAQRLTDRHGAALTFQLPPEALEGTYFRAGIDLEIQQETPQ